MGTKDPRVDAYIERAPAFAQPILKHLRRKFHEAVPELEETIKWGAPSFDHHGPLGMMAAFKAHCRFGFWARTQAGGMRPQIERLESLQDLPADRTLIRMMKEAAALRASGAKMPRSTRPKPPVKVPSYFLAAVRKNRRALAAFEAFPPSHKREYVEWITEAKTDETRRRRLDTAVQWLSEGKPRNWKYVRAKD